MVEQRRITDVNPTFATLPRRRRQRLDPRVDAKIEDLATRGFTAQRILIDVQSDPELSAHAPTIRTIQRRIEEIAARDVSGPWQLLEGTADEAAAVFHVLPLVISETFGRITHVTRLEARCLVRLLTVAGDLSPWSLYVLARAYAARQRSDVPTTDLDAFVAFHPWADRNSSDAYALAVGLGYVPLAPRHLATLATDAKADWRAGAKQAGEWRDRSRAAARPYLDDVLNRLQERDADANRSREHNDQGEAQ